MVTYSFILHEPPTQLRLGLFHSRKIPIRNPFDIQSALPSWGFRLATAVLRHPLFLRRHRHA